MRVSSLPLVLTFVFLIQVSRVSGQDENHLIHTCSGDNYTSNSAYQKNLNTLLQFLSLNNDMNHGFYNVSVGKGGTRVDAIALCRGKLDQTACHRCLRFSTTDLPVRCPSAKEAIIWYDNCTLGYPNQSIFQSVEATALHLWKLLNDNETYLFSRDLLVDLYLSIQQATSGDSHKKSAVADTYADDDDTRIYGLVQCTPEFQCTKCLKESFKKLPYTASTKQGGVLGPSCNFRYESYKFYKHQLPSPPPRLPSGPPLYKHAFPMPPPSFSSPPSSPPPLPPPSAIRPAAFPIGQATNIRIPNIIVIVTPTLGFMALLICLLILLKRRKDKLQNKAHQLFLLADAHDIRSLESLQFDFETLKVATNNFNHSSKLGQGGFGSVYKGKLADGKEIAVKRLAVHSGQGDLEFTNEVILLAKLQHRNLVRLLGFCLKGNERLLVYEFVANSSLDHFLFDFAKRVCLDWEARYKIINGIAKGLLYLHEDSRLRVIHRDLKAGNILLDHEMCPKIADFGMARLFSLNQTQGDTTRIVGTYGYMAPEYAMHGKFSVKSDVYSFGILLLEIISGQKNNRFSIEDAPHELTDFTWENWKAGTPSKIIDPVILQDHNGDILRSIHIALLCVQDSVSARPTMAFVVFMLGNATLALPIPSKPAIFTSAEFELATTSSLRGEVCTTSVNQVSISDDLPR